MTLSGPFVLRASATAFESTHRMYPFRGEEVGWWWVVRAFGPIQTLSPAILADVLSGLMAPYRTDETFSVCRSDKGSFDHPYNVDPYSISRAVAVADSAYRARFRMLVTSCGSAEPRMTRQDGRLFGKSFLAPEGPPMGCSKSTNAEPAFGMIDITNPVHIVRGRGDFPVMPPSN